jgi:predicted RNase H-like nuclease (RuvC/YqgF family)
MRALYGALAVAAVVVLTPLGAQTQEYDGCNEQGYDSVDEPCGGGHQHSAGKRDENSIERARHRHRYLESQIDKLKEQVAALSKEVEQLKKAGSK